MTNELQTVGAMHQCRVGEPYSTCVYCGALAEALNKPCPHFVRDAMRKLSAVASPTPQADSQPAKVERFNPLEGGNAETALQMAAVIALRDSQPAPVLDYLPLPQADQVVTPRNSEPYGLWGLRKIIAYVDADRAARAPADSVTAPAGGPIAWESTTLGYTKYITQSRYEMFSPAVRAWYKPYKCSNCTATQPTQAQAGAVPQCYQSGTLMSTPDGGMTAHLHFDGSDGVEAWFDTITDGLAANSIKGGQHGT